MVKLIYGLVSLSCNCDMKLGLTELIFTSSFTSVLVFNKVGDGRLRYRTGTGAIGTCQLLSSTSFSAGMAKLEMADYDV